MTQIRQLILMRHGQASNGAPSDRERELTAIGKTQVTEVAQQLVALKDWRPQVALVSDALRTQQTWQMVQPKFDLEMRVSPELYLGGHQSLMVALSAVDNAVGTALVIGHNPGLSEIASQLTGEMVGLSPSHAALVRVQSEDWLDSLSALGQWDLVSLLQPSFSLLQPS